MNEIHSPIKVPEFLTFVQCDKCHGEGTEEYEVWTEIYKTRTCSRCKGTKSIYSPETRAFIKALNE